jgi:invasion protein IalB
MTGSNRIETQPQRDCATFSFLAAFLAAAASFASSQPAVSQQTDVAPRGQREATDVTYGDWRKLCFKPGGAQMQKPARLTVDQGQPHLVPYTWCLANACIAATVADPKMIQEMGSGQTLRLEFVDSNLLTLTTSLPLAQFASVNKGPPVETFEQDIDE